MRFFVRRCTVAALAGAALLAPATASAALEDRSFEQTFPAAAALCARADAGRLPTRLAGSVVEVLGVCRDLHAAFDATTSDLDAALVDAQALPRPADRAAAKRAARARAAAEIQGARIVFWQAIRDIRKHGTVIPV